MDNCKNIFVVVEANSKIQPAIIRAQQIAELNGAVITLCLGANSRAATVSGSEIGNNLEKKQELEDNCKAFLSMLSEPLRAKNIEVNYSIGWEDEPVSGIIKAAEKSNADLLIKASRHHSKIKTLFYTPTDWKLLRQSPSPVLMVHSDKPAIPKKTLAAVSAISVDEEHLQLDHKLLNYAASISNLFKANLKVINAYTAVPLGVSLDGSGIYQDEYLQDLELQHHSKTLELTRNYGIKDEQVETRNGDPNTAISECVDELDIDLVIMGTIAREGLSGMFIGNTAERILEQLDCDILTIK